MRERHNTTNREGPRISDSKRLESKTMRAKDSKRWKNLVRKALNWKTLPLDHRDGVGW
jgi:hypothetical protein